MWGGDIDEGESANSYPEALQMAKDKIGKDCLRCATIALHPTLKSKYCVYLKIKT